MVEYEIIDETYYPYDNYTTWFAVRWPYPTSPEKYFHFPLPLRAKMELLIL